MTKLAVHVQAEEALRRKFCRMPDAAIQKGFQGFQGFQEITFKQGAVSVQSPCEKQWSISSCLFEFLTSTRTPRSIPLHMPRRMQQWP